jgi:hypothetical protein
LQTCLRIFQRFCTSELFSMINYDCSFRSESSPFQGELDNSKCTRICHYIALLGTKCFLTPKNRIDAKLIHRFSNHLGGKPGFQFRINVRVIIYNRFDLITKFASRLAVYSHFHLINNPSVELRVFPIRLVTSNSFEHLRESKLGRDLPISNF